MERKRTSGVKKQQLHLTEIFYNAVTDKQKCQLFVYL